MSYSLKNLPDQHARPVPLKSVRWMFALAIMLAISIILIRVFGHYTEDKHIWLIALGISALLWSVAGTGCLLIWMLKDIRANEFNKKREKWILDETRKARRALQVLNTTFITGHTHQSQVEVTNALLNNENIIASQRDWNNNDSVRMSRIKVEPQGTVESLVHRLFEQIITELPLEQISDTSPLVIAFDSSSSLPLNDIQKIWDNVWLDNELVHPIEFIEEFGLAIIEKWLNTRIKDEALLLIVALQVMPEHPDNTAEAAVALLLGNRLTQDTLFPLALLHRPDPALPGELEAGMKMAAYNVPIKENIVKHLWLGGLTEKQHIEVMTHQNKHPAQAVLNEAIVTLDTTMGHAGAAAPWLALAAAAEIVHQTQLAQLVISGNSAQDVLWSTLVTPVASRQEMNL